MAADTFTEVTTQGLFGRIGDSIKGVLVGLVLVVVGAGLLFWNEGRAVKTAKDLAAGAKSVIHIENNAVVSANESKLVHLTATAATTQHLEDKQFGISPKENVLKLRRDVQMYQWKETEKTEKEKNLGGSETTRKTYTYSKTWSDKLIDSTSFKQPGDHANPQTMKFSSQTPVASPINTGAFVLAPELTAKINNFEPLPVAQPEPTPAGPEKPAGDATAALPSNLKVADGGYYLGADPSSPQIGDTKIMFSVVKSGPVSAIGRQVGNQIGSFIGDNGTDLAMLQIGTVSAADMFKAAEAANRMLTW
ncbi:MAG: TMEM43 family protein, partial [Tepidisphaeraceae bacterium]